MQEFDHIQSLWQAHSVEVKISSDEMLAQVKKEVSAIRSKSVLNITGMICSLLVVAVLWLCFDFKSWAAHAGLTIFMVAIAASTFMLYRSHRLISGNDFTNHPNDFLEHLKLYQRSRFSLYNRMYWIYMIALSLGIILYFFEILDYYSFGIQVLIVLFTLGWIVFCSTLLRKATLKREKERIAILIEKFERLASQFREP